MNLSDIITKCYILALIIRDDGERLLLGDGIFEFKNSLQHFAPNIYQNDVVELQGTDGQLLAGQVRRSATQAFDGYIADGTIGKTDTEQSRRRFLGFFRKKHHYKVVYIMPDGTAVQRDRGYIVDAPAVQELYQRFPEYHIGLNFEDPNYYEYSENDEGEEIYTHIQAIALFRELEAGLVWDAFGAVSDDIAWIEYMTKNSTDGYILIGNGLPVEAPLSLTHLYGNATQKTLSGKNLLKIDFTSTAPTYAGITITNNGDGTITASGTTTGAGGYNLSPSATNQQHPLTLAPNTAYTQRLEILSGSADNIIVVPSFKDSGGTIHYNFFRNNQTTTTTDTMTCTFYNLYWGSAGLTINATFRVWLEKGSDLASPYEEYCGGTPSPNPDYPQAIKTVSGAQTVMITGKNLFDKDNTPTINNVYVDATGKVVLGSGNRFTYIKLQPNTTYTLTQGKKSNANVRLALFSDTPALNSQGTLIGSTYTTEPIVATFTTTNSNYYLGWSYANVEQPSTSTVAEILASIQLELGSTATDFEPYQGQSQAINLGGSNIFDISSATMANIYMNTNGWTSASNDWIGTDSYIEVEPNTTYTLSSSATAGTQVAINQYTSQSRSSFISPRIDTATFTTSATAKYISFSIKDPNATNIMLNKGSTALPYVPYTTYAYELAKIGTYQDYIWNDDGTWKIHKETGKVVLDGTESWLYFFSTSGIYTKQITPSAIIDSSTINCMSDYFTGEKRSVIRNNLATVDGKISITGTELAVAKKSSATTSDFATWLSTHNTAVYYPFATPTDTEITDSELIEQLNHIYELYQGVNNVWLIPSAGAQGEMTVRFGVAYDDDGSGYHWSEELGSPDNIISNDGIDSVRPIWIINGPATNPSLTNITTAQTITWNGTVPADSTLTIDMERQTATLNGANVYAQIEGDWLELAVGPNKLQYVASGGATADSTLEWNGVAG